MALARRRLRALGSGGAHGGSLNALYTLVTDQLRLALLTRRYRKWLNTRGTALS
jgi:hypothetical protein